MATGRAVPNVPKTITLRELEGMKSTSSIFVENTSPRTHRGDVLFQVSKPNGGVDDIVRVHKTWIPQDLTEQVPRKQLIDSANFRRTVNNGLVTLLHPDYAEGVLQTDDAKEESTRLRNLMNAASAILNSAAVTEKDERTPTQKRREGNQAKVDQEEEEKREREELSGVANSKAAAFEAFLNSLEGKTETAVVNALRGEGAFTRAEVKLIRTKFEDAYPRVKSWCDRMLEKKK